MSEDPTVAEAMDDIQIVDFNSAKPKKKKKKGTKKAKTGKDIYLQILQLL